MNEKKLRILVRIKKEFYKGLSRIKWSFMTTFLKNKLNFNFI